MPQYMIAIQKQAPDYPEITVEFEVKTKKEAIGRSKEIIKDVAEQFSKGYYTGNLYRKTFFLGWYRINTSEINYTRDAQ